MSTKKGGRKGKKAMLIAASLNPAVDDIPPNHISDMPTLEQQIRRFVDDLGGKPSMALPPMDKATRKKVHELAIAFGLKSQSKGKGTGRYTTLIRTTRTGIRIDEKKVSKILRRNTDDGGFSRPYERGAQGKAPLMPRHREGDEVGKVCSPSCCLILLG